MLEIVLSVGEAADMAFVSWEASMYNEELPMSQYRCYKGKKKSPNSTKRGQENIHGK